MAPSFNLSTSVSPNKLKNNSSKQRKKSTAVLCSPFPPSLGREADLGRYTAARWAVKPTMKINRITRNRTRSYMRSRMITPHGPNKWWKERKSNNCAKQSIIDIAKNWLREYITLILCSSCKPNAAKCSKMPIRLKNNTMIGIQPSPARSCGSVSCDNNSPDNQINKSHSYHLGSNVAPVKSSHGTTTVKLNSSIR